MSRLAASARNVVGRCFYRAVASKQFDPVLGFLAWGELPPEEKEAWMAAAETFVMTLGEEISNSLQGGAA